MRANTTRRGFMRGLLGAGAVIAVSTPTMALADPDGGAIEALVPAAPKSAAQYVRLTLAHAHVHEFVRIDNVLDPANREAIETFFRDWRDNERHAIDQRLLLGLADLWERAGRATMTLVSGYRSAKTNRLVGGVKESQHLGGIAADVAFADLPTAKLFKLAKAVADQHKLALGEYPTYGFVHLDAGRPRRWVGGRAKAEHA